MLNLFAVSFSSLPMSAAPSANQNPPQTSTPDVDDTTQLTDPVMVALPGYFEDVALDDLVVLIGE